MQTIRPPIDVVMRLSKINPTSRDNLIDQIESISGSALIRKIDSHNTASLLFVFQESEITSSFHSRTILKAEFGSSTATEKEIDWYARTTDYGCIPKMLFSQVTETHSLLIMEYIDKAQTVDSLMLEDATFSALDYYRQALTFDRNLFQESKPRNASLDEMDQFYVGKFKQRLQASVPFDYLRQLINQKNHIINGKKYRSLGQYIEKINRRSSLRNYLLPRTLGRIHGDLHGGNILIARNKLYLVDPNGSPELPLEYDIGKVLHSVHGNYPAIMNGSYVLSRDEQAYIFQLIPVVTVQYPDIMKLFCGAEYQRGLYAEAMHFATMLPHHANDKRETTALFLRSLELFDELYYVMDIK